MTACVLYLGWTNIAFSTVLVEGYDESLTHRAEPKKEKEQDLRHFLDMKRCQIGHFVHKPGTH